MSLPRAIGGYFELELPKGAGFLHDDAVLLNSGRACFEALLRTIKPRRVLMPKYTCDVMLEPLKNTQTAYDFYAITEQLEIKDLPELTKDELLLYVNYFGVKDDYVQRLAERYGSRLVIDNAQAFYAPPIPGAHTLYSPRKFFGLPDGGIIYSNVSIGIHNLEQDTSYGRCMHLLKRIDKGAEAGYQDFKIDDASLNSQPIRTMSNLTRRLLGDIDFAAIRTRREANYKILHQALRDKNQLRLSDTPTGPMVYPFRAQEGLRQKLIDAKVYVATYWPNVYEWAQSTETEYMLVDSIVALPIDQRYGADEMQRILEVING
jgi:hypothetical protein